MSDGPLMMARRKVRKGTRSCRECRGRKVRCIFASPSDHMCVACRRRGAKCISQMFFDPSDSAEPFADDTSSTSSGSGAGRQLLARRPTSSSGALSAFSIYDAGADSFQTHNLEHRQRQTHVLPPTPHSHRASPSAPQTRPAITQELLRALPSNRDIEILLGKANLSATLCYQSTYIFAHSREDEVPTPQIALGNLLYPDSHPVLLARQMLLFAGGLQHLHPKEALPGLTTHHRVIMDGIVNAVTKLVTTNDALLGTLENLENIVLESFYHIDMGNIRRAWMTMRRGVMAAQMVGLHRPGHYRFKVIHEDHDLNPQAMWTRIASTERILSLLLGLPTSTSSMALATDTRVELSTFPVLLADITAEILERNQIEDAQEGLDKTAQIDRELLAICQQLPSSFWRPATFFGLAKDSSDAFRELKRMYDQMCYHTLVIQLHLPHMLSPTHADQRQYSKVACVRASREILTQEIALRTFEPVSACCRMADFRALIAGMTLMLAQSTSHCGHNGNNMLAHQRMIDRATVEQALECMQIMSESHEDMLAAKCAAMLKDLLAIEEDAAQQRMQANKRPPSEIQEDDGGRNLLIMRVPYLGAMKISRTGVATVAPPRVEQDGGSQEDVSIGGIGSMRVSKAALPGHLPVPECQAPVAENIVPDQYATGDLLFDSAFINDVGMFPDAPPGLPDWGLQGLDTAFFDVLMRGTGGQQSEGDMMNGWNLGAFD